MSPTYEASARVLRELRKLPLGQRRAFLAARDEFVAALQHVTASVSSGTADQTSARHR